jgi:RND family efflux transporter MFP subunit
MLVEVMTLHRTNAKVIIESTGIVTPAREITLHARVSGEVVHTDDQFEPGGLFSRGEEILRLDPVDYELALKNSASALRQAEHDYKLELGRQDIARHEWTLIDDRDTASELDRELTLRKPHLAKAQAALAAAKARHKQAQLDLERTHVRAPFNAVVRSRQTDLGAQVTPQTALGTLVGTDEYWVETTLPVDQLRWISIPSETTAEGAQATVYPAAAAPGQAGWKAQVIRRRVDLEPQGRLAQLVLAVPDPLKQQSQASHPVPLLLESFVRVEIIGPRIEDVFSIPRAAIRDGHHVWTEDADHRLHVQFVDILWGDRDRVLIRNGLQEGTRIVTSDIAAPVPGMLLREKRQGQDAPSQETVPAEKGPNP